MIKLLSGKCILQENRRQLPFYIRIRYKHIKSYIIVYDNLFSYISSYLTAGYVLNAAGPEVLMSVKYNRRLPSIGQAPVILFCLSVSFIPQFDNEQRLLRIPLPSVLSYAALRAG